MNLLLTCEHARCALPAGVDLGVSPDRMRSHISFDRGAVSVAERLAQLTSAPLHLGRYSRLLVDLNRREANPDVIVQESSSVPIPGNVGLTPERREARVARWHRPWREAVRMRAFEIARGAGCMHLSMHSFEPALDPERRGFDVGVLFDPARTPERDIAEALAEHLRASGLTARLNEPYRGTPEGATSWLRDQLAEDRYVGLEIEASYALLDREGGAERLAQALLTAASRGGALRCS